MFGFQINYVCSYMVHQKTAISFPVPNVRCRAAGGDETYRRVMATVSEDKMTVSPLCQRIHVYSGKGKHIRDMHN
jgi:hypothetical protein